MSTSDFDFWQVEAACRDAWPAQEERDVMGWRMRLSGSPTRRTNSLNPLQGYSSQPEVVTLGASLYKRQGKSSIFRIPSFANELDPLLEKAGYRKEGETLTFGAQLSGGKQHPDVSSCFRADAAWLAARQRISGDTDAQIAAFSDVTGRITAPVCFVARYADERIVSIAYGVVVRGMLVFESVATDPACRGKGYARDALLHMMDWAWQQGARQACLQVVADNDPAIGLYSKLGFDRFLYEYHYRVKA